MWVIENKFPTKNYSFVFKNLCVAKKYNCQIMSNEWRKIFSNVLLGEN